MRNLCLVFILLVIPALTFCQSLPPNPPNCIQYTEIDLLDNCTSCDSGYVLEKNSTSGYMLLWLLSGLSEAHEVGAEGWRVAER